MAAKVVWAIDVGQVAVRAVKAVRAGDRIEVLAFDSVPYKEMLSAPGVDKDASIQQALRSLVVRNRITTETVVVAIPSQSALVRFIKLPPVEEKRIPDIVRYEAHQQIPFPLEEVVWAYKPLEKGYAPGEQVEVGIFAMRRDIVNRFLSNLMVCGIDVDVLQLAPMALYNFLSFDRTPTTDATLLLDIGAENTELLLATQTSVWPRSLPVSGNDLTEAIMEKFKVPFDKAETLKRMAKQSKYSAQIYQAIEPLLKRMVEEIQRSIGFYRSMTPGVRIAGILGLGGSFRLPGLGKYLSENLHLPLQTFEAPQNFDVSRARNPVVFQEDTYAFGVALGLAAQGLGLAPMDISLLPPELLQHKMIARKKPYAAAVAVLAVVAALAGWFSTYQQKVALARASETRYLDRSKELEKHRADFDREKNVEPLRLKMQAAEKPWRERGSFVPVYERLFDILPEPQENAQGTLEGIWLIRVVTQRFPFEQAAQILAERQALESGLREPRPGEYEEDPNFRGASRSMSGPMTLMGVGGLTRPGVVQQTVEREDIIRVVVVGETSHPNQERHVTNELLNPLTAKIDVVYLTDGSTVEGEVRDEGDKVTVTTRTSQLELDKSRVARIEPLPRFLEPIMLKRQPVSRFVSHQHQPVELSSEERLLFDRLKSIEESGGHYEPTKPGEKVITLQDFLSKLRDERGYRLVEFTEFVAAFFVDHNDELTTRVSQLRSGTGPTGMTPGFPKPK